MKMPIVCAVPQMIMAMMSKVEPPRATYLLPIRSEMEPTKGHMAAKASRYARTNQIHRSTPPISA
jgi:hypothetical protein